MHIIISGKNIDLTDAIENYVTKKVNGLDKYYSGIIRVDVTVGESAKRQRKGNLFFAEAKIEVPGYDVFVRKESVTLYAAIDDLKDNLERELKKHKIKMEGNLKKKRAIGRQKKEYTPEE